MEKIGWETSKFVTSNARVFPDAFSALMKASLGVVSQHPIRCIWATQSVWATTVGSASPSEAKSAKQ
jgi:hypothetical protein